MIKSELEMKSIWMIKWSLDPHNILDGVHMDAGCAIYIK